jgi:hypothetical protein
MGVREETHLGALSMLPGRYQCKCRSHCLQQLAGQLRQPHHLHPVG